MDKKIIEFKFGNKKGYKLEKISNNKVYIKKLETYYLLKLYYSIF